MSNPKRLITFAIAGLFSLLAWQISSMHTQFQESLTQISGVKLSETKAEVLYRLGSPTYVLSDEVTPPKAPLGLREGGFRKVHTVNTRPDDVNRLPENKQVSDFSRWFYESENEASRLDFEFGADERLKSISIYCTEGRIGCWEPIAGIESAADEDQVLRLGAPYQIVLESEVKTIKFEDLGITVKLRRGKTYYIDISGPQRTKSIHLRRFLNSLL
jgi:hypothetical protein